MYTDEFGVQFSDDKKILIKCPQEFEGAYKIPDGVEEIGDMAFANAHITSVVIPDTVHGIGSGAFSTCHQLRAIELPPYLEELGDHAFVFSNIKSISIPSTVSVINDSTFMSCENLKEVMLSEGLTRIESYAFNDCTSLESVTLPQSVSYIGSCAFSGCSNLKPVGLPDVIEVCASAFDSDDNVIMPKDQSRINIIQDDDDYDDEDGWGDDELGEKIEGDGVIRHISYYENEECLVILHLHVFDDRLQILREIRSMADNGFADVIDVHEKQKLMHVLNVGKDEDVIDALMEKCKTEWCSLDMDKFYNFLESNLIQYNRTKTGDFGVDWSGDEPIIKYYPIKK